MEFDVPHAGTLAAATPGRPACRFCGAPLDPHHAARGAVCAAPRCQMQRVQQASRAVFQRDWEGYVRSQRKAVEASGPLIARAARMLGAGAGELVIGVVPHQDRPLVPLPERRRREFAAHLDTIIADAFAEPVPELDLTQRLREEAEEHPLIGATCGACQGKCCSLGGPQMAFLAAADIQRHRRRHPAATAADVRAHYLGRIPVRSVEHACVYQSERGCTLDRAERSDLCNRYHCNPQTRLLQRLREAEASKAVIVANEGDAGPVVAAFDMAGGARRVSDGIADGQDEIAPGDAPGVAEAMAALDAALAQIPPPLPERGAGEAPGPSGCRFCGAALTPHQRATTRACGAPACVQRRIAETSRVVAERKLARYIARRDKVIATATAELERAATALGAMRESLLVGVVPYQNRPVIPLPPERRAEFEAHLDRIIDEGFAAPVTEVNLGERAALEVEEEPLMQACCATCQGSCCALGGPEKAFLSAREIQLHRQRYPEATPDEVRAFYLGRLPERSVAGACVFQSATGCALPREQRAYICNAFHCQGQAMLHEAWRKARTREAAIVAHADTVPRAVAVFREETGWRPVVRPDGPDDS